MSKAAEQRVFRAIAAQYGLALNTARLDLEGWGYTDGAAEVGNRAYVVAEVETSQKHSCTNVLKLWPYLEANSNTKIVLVHVFDAGATNDSSSRGSLAAWVGERMATELPDQFCYCRLSIDGSDQLTEVVGDLDSALTWLGAQLV
ncbi:MAG: hypothetical protein AB1512_16435 [Thermodesulfobacteriota bacterium]